MVTGGSPFSLILSKVPFKFTELSFEEDYDNILHGCDYRDVGLPRSDPWSYRPVYRWGLGYIQMQTINNQLR